MRRRLPAPRLSGFDYRDTRAYFVTTNTQGRARLLGRATRSGIVLSRAGEIVLETWRALPSHYPHVALDAFVVMPDHVHGIVILHGAAALEDRHPLTEVVRALKSYSSLAINKERGTPGARVWQRGFHDRIVRDHDALAAIRAYIRANPARWWAQHGDG